MAAGHVTGFVGPNGAGKSTTMRMMVGLTRPDVGDVRYAGVHYGDLRHPARTVGSVLDAAGNHLLSGGSGLESPAAAAVALTRSENALVFAGYTAVALVLGTVLLYRRDAA